MACSYFAPGLPASPPSPSPSLRAVVVKPLAALATEPPGHHHALQERGWGVTWLAELLEHDLGHEHGGVEPHQVEERERPHGVAAAELHGLVDVLEGGESALVHPDRVQEVRHQEP